MADLEKVKIDYSAVLNVSDNIYKYLLFVYIAGVCCFTQTKFVCFFQCWYLKFNALTND